MCGIIGAFKHSEKFKTIERVKRQYQAQKSRGTQGFGFVAGIGKEIVYYKSETEKDVLAALEELNDPTFILFHHRIPTSTENNVISNHPIFIHNKKNLSSKYFLIHNGHISNADLLKKDHEKLGINYRTTSERRSYFNSYSNKEYTDSEAAGIELALFIEKGKPFNAIGTMAIIMLEINKNNKPISVYTYRNSNPIKFYRNQHGCFYSSEGPGYMLSPGILTRYDLESGLLESMNIGYENSSNTKIYKDNDIKLLCGNQNKSTDETLDALYSYKNTIIDSIRRNKKDKNKVKQLKKELEAVNKEINFIWRIK